MKHQHVRMLIAAILVVVIAFLMTGCAAAYKPKAMPAQCDALCYTPCVGKDGDTGVRITGDAQDAGTWDEIGETLAVVFRQRIERCDAHREACTACLKRLEKAGVIQTP